jgi:uncharacterized protein (TIGR00299 family) protein
MKREPRVLWIDATAGASGDMILGALVDAGVPLRVVRETVERLGVEGWKLSSRRVRRATLSARFVRVSIGGPARDDAHVHHGEKVGKAHGRTKRSLFAILRRAKLPGPVYRHAAETFERLFHAEAKAHGLPVERVHLHEAGAVDALVDVVGVAAAVRHLAPRRIVVSPVATGSGTVRCAHGIFPVPVPAVVELLHGVPVTGEALDGERLTPTGAALLATLADSWGPLPAMRPLASGTGAGARDPSDRPNVVRAVLGEERDPAEGGRAHPTVVTIECAVDDATPQAVAWALERVREAGALEAYALPATMKKGRPGHHLTVLVRPGGEEGIASLLLRETTSLGVRFRTESRVELARRVESVRTRWGPVRVKIGSLDERDVNAWPEYEDCAAVARAHGVPLADVQREALRLQGGTPPRVRTGPRRGDS